MSSRFAPFPLFLGMDGVDLDLIERATLERTLKDGEVLFKQGHRVSPHEGLYFVHEGALRVVNEAEGLDRVLPAGSMVGLFGLVDGEPRSADCIAMGPTRLSTLSRQAYQALQRTEHRFAARFEMAVARQLAGDIRALTLRQQAGAGSSTT